MDVRSNLNARCVARSDHLAVLVASTMDRIDNKAVLPFPYGGFGEVLVAGKPVSSLL